jgi:predicted flap endonuclease-1-like 5' DNA nuclease
MENCVLWFILGLILGLVIAFVISRLLWRRWASECESRILRLQQSLGEKEQDLRGLNEHLQEQKVTIVQLRDQVSQGETRIGSLAALLEEKDKEAAVLQTTTQEGATRASLAVAAAPPDDLELIEGIGPRMSELLRQAGITTFAQLAVTEASRLIRIVREAGLAMIDPRTWPEQARLAADGQWDALQVLQDVLKGGRRV